MLELRPDAPLDPMSVAIIDAVSAAGVAAGAKVVLVGATARDIVLSHVYGIRLRRATADLDFAIAISGWDAFHRVLAHLQEGGRFRAAKDMVHRLYFAHPAIAYDIPVDIVPFGEGVGGMTFLWPGDPDLEMNVQGYVEAETAALDVDISGKSVRVLDAAGLALLKVFAWKDRRAKTKKDASDLLVLLKHYPELGNEDRMYEDAALLDDVGHDYLRGGARLLGRDVRRMCEEQTLAGLQALLATPAVEKLAEDAYRENADSGLTIDQVTEAFDDFAREVCR